MLSDVSLSRSTQTQKNNILELANSIPFTVLNNTSFPRFRN